MRQYMRVVHGDLVQLLAILDVRELPHDTYFCRFLALELWRTFGSPITKLAVEQFHKSFNPISTAQVLREHVRWIHLAPDLPEL